MKLTYLELAFWKGEVPRLCMNFGNIDFEDVRIERSDWPKFKESMPFKQLPVLEVEGRWVTQGTALIRYTAQLSNLYPKDYFEAAKCDEIINLIDDFTMKVDVTMRMSKEEEKKSAREELVKSHMRESYTRLEKAYKSVGTGVYLFDTKLSAVDLTLWSFSEWLTNGTLKYFPDKNEQFGDFPRLLACIQSVDSIPAIQSWKTKYSRHYYPN